MVAPVPALGTLAVLIVAIGAVFVAVAGPDHTGALVRQAPATANATTQPATAAAAAAAAAANTTAAPAPAAAASTASVPAGKACNPPGGVDDYAACVKSCSAVTMTCTAASCCVHRSSGGESVSFCYMGCCGRVLKGAPVESTVFSESGVCNSGKALATAANGTTTPTTNTTKNGTANASPDPIPNAGTASGSSIPAGGNESKSTSCFPEHALVQLESGQRRRMDELAVGDRVLVAHKVYSDVFMFTHKLAAVRSQFVSIRTASGHKISASPGHYLYANGALVPASAVRPGDRLPLGSGSTSVVVSVSTSGEAGLYNPQTLHGDIVVDGVVASTYTTAVSPRLGHAWLAPFRALYATFGLTSGLLDNGADTMVSMIPGGSDAY